MKESFKCLGNFLAYKYSVDTKNFGDFDFNFRVEPDLELNLKRNGKKLVMTIEDIKNNFSTIISWVENRRLFQENGMKTLLTFSNFCLSLLIDLEDNKREESEILH